MERTYSALTLHLHTSSTILSSIDTTFVIKMFLTLIHSLICSFGDEFAVIITEDINEFENMIHRFKSNITNWHGEFVDSMTVSYGWVFSTEGNWGSIYEISKAADERMYESKEHFYNESGVNRR